MGVIEVHPRTTNLRVLQLHDRAAVITRRLPGSRDVGQRAAMCSFRAPTNHDVAVTGGEHLFDVEVQIGEGCYIQLEELPSAFVASERGGSGIRFPRYPHVQS